jgi:ectoine hydroxylase-related dioxygenase (phytanoyl-CoA dioxygenase family)
MIRPFTQPLTSNGYQLSMTPDRLGWLDASDLLLPVADLRARFQREGVLWLKRLMDRERVLAFRRRYFEQFPELLVPGTDAVEGLWKPSSKAGANAQKRIGEIVRWAAYESLCLSWPLVQFFEAFLGGPVYLHKRKLIRHTTPVDSNSTGAHYDLVYLRAGTDRVVTAWIPLGDISVEMGGLVYLKGSDTWGRQMEAEFSAKNAALPPEERINAFNKNMGETGWLTKDLPSLADRLNTQWLAADYEAGDVVLHSAYMIHAATTNVDSHQRLRLSTDIRYQLVSDVIDPRWGEHWSPDDKL